ncbi:MAG: thioesterase superfamily protein [Gemmatimonadetes bacterium]|nr:thioesterase superfamily protein [Gemmatimonadota bacterium]
MTGRDPQELARAVTSAMLAKDEFSRWLGITVLAVSPGSCTASMLVRPEMVNGFGVSHGGVTYSLADSALAFAGNTNGRVTLAIENSISYPAPVQVGDTLTAVATEESASNRLAFYTVRVTQQEGRTVAIFRGTVYRTHNQHFND